MKRIIGLFALCLASLVHVPAMAQGYPNRPITVVNGFEAGGGADILIRALLPDVSQLLGQQLVMNYHTGAGGNIAINFVAKAPADGYTLLLAAPGVVTNPYIYIGAQFDVTRDFAPVTLIGSVSNVLIVNLDVPANSVQELIALAKSRPGSINYASPGVGSSLHLAAELLKHNAGIELIHVPYKGGMQAQTDVTGGHVQLMFNVLPSALPMIKAGKLRALAVTGLARDPMLPDTPTMMEAGVPNYTAVTWNGILTPAGTPRDIVAKLNAAFVEVLKRPETKQRLNGIGQSAVWSTSEEFAEFLRKEQTKWSAVMNAANIKPQ